MPAQFQRLTSDLDRFRSVTQFRERNSKAAQKERAESIDSRSRRVAQLVQGGAQKRDRLRCLASVGQLRGPLQHVLQLPAADSKHCFNEESPDFSNTEATRNSISTYRWTAFGSFRMPLGTVFIQDSNSTRILSALSLISGINAA
jgi:hypothetical protein